jgi:hypothetical protein
LSSKPSLTAKSQNETVLHLVATTATQPPRQAYETALQLLHSSVTKKNQEACHLRVSPTPELRVISLTTDKVTNEFALAFALGSSDYGLVDNDHPLTINVTRKI